jgi:hypothetical protein
VPSPDPLDDLESLTPPDGKWEKDADGREYFVTRLPRVKDTYYIPEGREWIQYKRLYRWPLVKTTDTHFYVKLYRADAVADPAPPAPPPPPPEPGFEFEEVLVDRLQFSSFDTGLPRTGQWRQGFDVADMNGDGQLDIVHGSPRKDLYEPVIFLGDGAGNWRKWEDVSWPPLAYDYGDAAAGDVNGDGLMDIGLGVHLRGVLVLIQEAPGRFVDGSKGLPFEVPGRGGDAAGFASRAVDFADWNGDGRLDLIALGEGARQSSTVPGKGAGLPVTTSYGVVVFVNQGDGTWSPRGGGLARGVFGDSFAYGDFNDDGRVDIASSSHTMGLRGLLMLNSEAGDGWEAAPVDSMRRRAFTYSITSGDFNGDGRTDLVTGLGAQDGDTSVSGLEYSSRDRAGVWSTRLLLAADGVEAAWALGSGDLDGDGHRDVVATTQMGKVIVLLGDGKGGFAREESPELDTQPACRGYGLELADLDRDGRDDIVASFAAEMGEMERLLERPECVGQGSVRVWRASPRSGAPASGS